MNSCPTTVAQTRMAEGWMEAAGIEPARRPPANRGIAGTSKADETIDALRAELQQAQEREQRTIGDYEHVLGRCQKQRQQAIDALREIDHLSNGLFSAAGRLQQIVKVVRAALVKLGEQP